MGQSLAFVAIENVAYHFDILYAYLIPDDMLNCAAVGVRVQVPFGRSTSQRQGIIFSFGKAEKNIKYKYLTKVLDNKPLLTEEMIKIALFLKDRTFCTYFEAAKIQLPAGLNFKFNITYVALEADDKSMLTKKELSVYDYMLERVTYLSKEEIFSECNLPENSDVIEKLVSKGFVHRNYDANAKVGDLKVKTASLSLAEDELNIIEEKLSDKQKSVVRLLRDVGSASVKEICYFTGVSSAVIATLSKREIIKISDCDVFRIPKHFSINSDAGKPIELTESQTKAYKNLLNKYKNGGGVSLLYGVTGSGKTSVFIKLIDEVIKDGKQVIVMVPEIALTPQLISVFKGRYGSAVAVFHSALSMGERKDEYRRVKDGKVQIAVGTRSAVFAPFDNIGLIVIDEEQEHTYKSESSPKFHARDVAKFRIAYHKGLLLLSSATPSIESYTQAKRGVYSLEILEKRFGNAVLPDVTVVDMKADRSAGNKYIISSFLQEMIDKNLEEKKQTILLMNRRGYNTFATCESCGNVVTCPNCSISMTYHSANGRLMCHYCGHSVSFLNVCPSCGEADKIRYSGYGTQKIEEELKTLFPKARILRLDADSSSSRYAFETKLLDFGKGDYDIMLGTQMVAKGLNFENVTLVGVINSDSQLSGDDFRSEELTFDLLTQVVGRSGRGKEKGIAVIQTMIPENNIINLAQKQDYDSFYNNEIAIRKCLIYPPFCDICTVTAIGEKELRAFSAAKYFVEIVSKAIQEEYSELKLIILQPTAPRVAKINNKFRFRIIIKCKNSKRFREMISKQLILASKNKTFSNISFVADINPSTLS